jgi:hypothetical protein
MAEEFVVDLPTGLTAQTSAGDAGQTVVVFENSDGTMGFQVSVAPFSDSITAEELVDEYPELGITDLNTIFLNNNAQTAYSFHSVDPDMGEMFEIWSIHDGLLYQLMTYRRLETWLLNILETWRFR